MNSLRYLYDRQVRYIVAAVVLLLATIAPSIAMAAQVTERSIEVSSSTVSATGVSYKVAFNAISTAESFVIDFCSNSPLIGQSCSAPAGLNVDNATSSDVTINGTATTANKIVATDSIAAGPVEFEFANIINPSAEDTIYARIVTFAASGGAATYTSGTPGTVADSGSVAMAFTNSIGVTADVLESLTFCVGDQAPEAGCTGTFDTPNLVLGDDLGNGVVALSTTAPNTADVYTQISTNAVGGAVVNLKSNATGCGGLLRLGAPGECDIAPAGTTGTIGAGEAKFGVIAAPDTNPVGDSEGVYQIHSLSSYDATNFRMNYVDANSGVTSVYGDPFLDTNGAPALNKNVKVTFGAQAANNTPAGRYQATLNLIATGKF